MLRADLFRPGDPNRAGVMHHIGCVGYVQAGRAEEQQHSGGDDSEQDAIHGRHADLKSSEKRDPGPKAGDDGLGSL